MAKRARGWLNGGGAAWRKIRARQLAAHPMSALCRSEPATEVDQIVRLADGGSFADPANLRSACRWCHSQRHAARPRSRVNSATGFPTDASHWWTE